MFKMKQRKIALVLIAILLSIGSSFAQKDTIRILQYNLLNYGDNDNPTSYKNPRLSTVLQYTEPDIFGANEIANSSAHSLNILNNVLGAGWTKGTFVNTGNEIQTNMLFWKEDKFGLVFQKTISYKLRDIIAFKLYYKDADLAQTNDTVFITLIIAHLKAGSTAQNETDRSAETQTVVNYLNSLGVKGNYIFMGDFNLYSSNEKAYQNLINNPNASGKLYDPINRPGNWSATSSFADIHTQSTRTSGLADGGASGGLDDRFDHILVSQGVMLGQSKFLYLQGSYTALGQDGKHFNKSVNASPANANVPTQVIQSLYEMSDHLPIYADFIISPSLFPTYVLNKSLVNDFRIVNPFKNELILTGSAPVGSFSLTMYSLATGLNVFSENIINNVRNNRIKISKNLQPGMYVVKVRCANGNDYSQVLIKE
jgi:hypothetical protein